MKKIYFLLMIFLPLTGFTQPVIDATDLPVAGFAYTTGTDTAYHTTMLPGGASQTWDYSGLINQIPDTMGFIPASSTPFAFQFPGANLAAVNLSEATYSYFTSEPTGFYFNGAISPGVNMILQGQGMLFAPVPFTYNDTRSNVARMVLDTTITNTLGTFLYRYIVNFTTNFIADGYGTVILPNGSYPDVLRLKVTQITYDTILVDPGAGGWVTVDMSAVQKTMYRFFQHGQLASYILGINADSLGINTDYSEYLTASVLLGTPDNSVRSTVASYPNPVSNVISFSGIAGNRNAHIRMYDVTGHLVLENHLTGTTGNSVDVSELPNGVYFYDIVTENASPYKGRFIVQH